MESEKKQRLVIDGNAFYEIDLKCLEKEETGSRKKTPAERAEEVTSALSANLFNSSCCSHIHYFRSRAEEG